MLEQHTFIQGIRYTEIPSSDCPLSHGYDLRLPKLFQALIAGTRGLHFSDRQVDVGAQ